MHMLGDRQPYLDGGRSKTGKDEKDEKPIEVCFIKVTVLDVQNSILPGSKKHTECCPRLFTSRVAGGNIYPRASIHYCLSVASRATCTCGLDLLLE